jgi:hypothetical protein
MSPGAILRTTEMSTGGPTEMSPGAIFRTTEMSPGGTTEMSPGTSFHELPLHLGITLDALTEFATRLRLHGALIRSGLEGQ